MTKTIIKNTHVTTLLCLCVVGGVEAQSHNARYVNCLDFSSVGSGLCRPDDPVPEAPQPKEEQKDKVKEFLDNYGKPAPEFVEFYLNPTPENAQKWNQTFRAQQLKAAEAAKAWQAALRAPEPASVETGSIPVSQRVESGLSLAVTPTQVKPFAAKQPVTGVSRLGAFATGDKLAGSVFYYFSVVDPYSAKLKPDLQGVMNLKKSKYKFTCVDLTPLSDKYQAQPANRVGLPCDWRMPRAGELESLKIQQTPVVVVQRQGQPAERVTGVVSKERLLQLLP